MTRLFLRFFSGKTFSPFEVIYMRLPHVAASPPVTRGVPGALWWESDGHASQ
jgi:hypothetical protein